MRTSNASRARTGPLPRPDPEAEPSAAHTSGPWTVIETGTTMDAAYLVIEDLPGRLKPVCATEYGHPLAEANARLIAKAPDMYAALKALMAASSEDEEFFAYQLARAAIAAVEGRS